MVTGEIPPHPILLRGQSMAGSEMPFEHLAAPATFDANDIIAMDGSPDRHGGCSFALGLGCRFAETRERLMHGRDQRPELVEPDLVLPNVCGDNCSRELSID
jgi:hypothetical protein